MKPFKVILSSVNLTENSKWAVPTILTERNNEAKKLFSLISHKLNAVDATSPSTSWDHVGNVSHVVAKLEEIVQFLDCA